MTPQDVNQTEPPIKGAPFLGFSDARFMSHIPDTPAATTNLYFSTVSNESDSVFIENDTKSQRCS